MPPNPPSKRVASPRAAWRFAPCKYPHFSTKILNPPRNEILDTPLIGSKKVMRIALPEQICLAYVTLGQGRKSIFKHRGIIFREFEVSWSWDTLLRQHVHYFLFVQFGAF